eukprot:scaffold10623_cov139-Isochrysis_galbana.AAC.2
MSLGTSGVIRSTTPRRTSEAGGDEVGQTAALHEGLVQHALVEELGELGRLLRKGHQGGEGLCVGA